MELLLTQARADRNDQRRLYEALDARAGIVLGFVGVLIATLLGTGQLASIGVTLSVLAALSHCGPFCPDKGPSSTPRSCKNDMVLQT